MTDGSKSINVPDNRLWAILLLGVGILLTGFLQQLENVSINREDSPQMMLHDTGGKLAWLPEDAVHIDHLPAVRSELTPFFFAPVPVNSAGRDLLTTLPGIGPGMAQRIIDFRTTNGPITSAEIFMRIPGIGSKRLEALQPYITFQ